MFPLLSHGRHSRAAHTGWDQAGPDYPPSREVRVHREGQRAKSPNPPAGCSASRDQPTHLLPPPPGARAEEDSTAGLLRPSRPHQWVEGTGAKCPEQVGREAGCRVRAGQVPRARGVAGVTARLRAEMCSSQGPEWTQCSF